MSYFNDIAGADIILFMMIFILFMLLPRPELFVSEYLF